MDFHRLVDSADLERKKIIFNILTNKFMKKQILITVAAILIIGVGTVSAATYIGKNLYTDGSLTVLEKATFMSDAEFHGDVVVNDGNYIKFPVITLIEPSNPNFVDFTKDDCSKMEHVGRAFVRYREGLSIAKFFICAEIKKGEFWWLVINPGF